MPGPPCLGVSCRIRALFHIFHLCELVRLKRAKGLIFVQSAPADSGFAGDPTSLARDNILKSSGKNTRDSEFSLHVTDIISVTHNDGFSFLTPT